MIKINKKTTTPLYLQIKHQFIELIMSGFLSPGDLLPSERLLADQLSVNRSTVNKAYWELKAEGFVHAQMGSGTVVSAQVGQDADDCNTYVPPMPWTQHMQASKKHQQTDLIKTALEAINEKDVISFAGGFAGDDALPLELIQKLMPKLLKKYKTALLHPTPLQGVPLLREAICNYLKPKGVQSQVSQCMITSGAQQSLSYIAKLFLSEGDMVFVASPSYIGAIEIFKASGAKVVGIPTDHFGMDTSVLENYLLRYRPKLIYLNPNFQNPTGTYLPLERRKKILELAYLYQIPIIEDDPYAELYFSPVPAPRLKAMDRHGYVIYIGTFSKQLFMGGRIGWLICEEEVMRRLSELKQLTDLHANTLHQYMMAELLISGSLEEHLSKLRPLIFHKRDIMVKALQSHNIDGLTFEIPEGSFYLWVKLPPHIYSHHFFETCKKVKISVLPGDPFYPEASSQQTCVRLNYSYPSEADIIEGIARFANAIKLTSTQSKAPTSHPQNLLL